MPKKKKKAKKNLDKWLDLKVLEMWCQHEAVSFSMQ